MADCQTNCYEIAEADMIRNLKETKEEVVYLPQYVDSFGTDHLPFWNQRMDGSRSTRLFNY